MTASPELDFVGKLPASLDAERTILGAILLDNNAYIESAARISAADFAQSAHQRIYRRMGEIIALNRPVDIVTLAEELARRKEIESIGGVSYIASLTEGLPRNLAIGEYVRIVKDKSLLRDIITVSSEAITRAADQSESAETVLQAAIRDLETASMRGASADSLESVGQYILAHDPLEQVEPGIPTGFEQWDHFTYGLHRGELTIIAARTSMGKTAFAGKLALNIGSRGRTVAVFINEQRKRSFINRMVCQKTGIQLEKFRRHDFSMIERHYIQEALNELKMLPIFFDDANHMTFAAIRSAARKLQRDEGQLDCIIVDQLSHIPNDGFREDGMRPDEIIGAKVLAHKHLAQDLGVPVVLFHQLNRGTEARADKRPSLSDLKGSGGCEEHSDNVAFLHRPGYYDPSDTSLKGVAEIILAKQRDGATGIVHCQYDEESTRWRDRD